MRPTAIAKKYPSRINTITCALNTPGYSLSRRIKQSTRPGSKDLKKDGVIGERTHIKNTPISLRVVINFMSVQKTFIRLWATKLFMHSPWTLPGPEHGGHTRYTF